MPFIRFLASKRITYIIAVILLFSKIILSCSYCEEKKLVYITIVAPFSHQLSSYFKCTKLNIYLLSNYINAYLRVWCTSLLFTRSVHQPPTYKALTNQGGGASVYRPHSLL